ncbi:MAG: hypothetical protein H7Z41_16775 [Cytophagales bacterium]|nr:hypothetical protein [Armatimonadota bacterium]
MRRVPQTMPPPASASAALTLEVSGDAERPGAWTNARLAAEFAKATQTIRVPLKGAEGVCRCAPLLALILWARPRPSSTRRKNPLLAFTVVVEGRDGYAAAFSLGELLPDYGNRAVWVVLDRDGKSLTETEAPVRLYVPGEARPSRSVFGVRRIILTDATGPRITPGAR